MVLYPDLSHTRVLAAASTSAEVDTLSAPLAYEGAVVDGVVLAEDGAIEDVEDRISESYDAVVAGNLPSRAYDPLFTAEATEDAAVPLVYGDTSNPVVCEQAGRPNVEAISVDYPMEDVLDEIDRQLRADRYQEVTEEAVSTARHDARNPLNIAMGRMSLINEADSLEKVREHSPQVSNALDRIDRIIGEMSTPYEKSLEDLDVYTEFNDCVDQFNGIVEADVTSYLPPHGARISADPEIGRAMDNLLQNAVDHGDATHIDVYGWVDETAVYVGVEDDGHGMAEYGIPERYRAGENGDDSSGSGLGLFITDHLVKSSWGRLTDEPSERLNGALFWIELPRSLPERAAQLRY